MRNSDQVEQGEGLTALRRRFLIDMSWPESSDVLCRIMGMLDASQDVQDAERLESVQRMNRLIGDAEVIDLVLQAARDVDLFLDCIKEPQERLAWLTVYALAVVNLLEDVDRLDVA